MNDATNRLITEAQGLCWHVPDPHHADECLKCHSAFQRDNYEPYNCCIEARPDYSRDWYPVLLYLRDDSKHGQEVEVGCWECSNGMVQEPYNKVMKGAMSPYVCPLCHGKGRVRIGVFTYDEFKIKQWGVHINGLPDRLIGPPLADAAAEFLKTLIKETK
jgi:hypothetical protein